VAIWEEEKLVGGSTMNFFIGEGYHGRWGKERKKMGQVENKGVEKGGWDHIENW